MYKINYRSRDNLQILVRAVHVENRTNDTFPSFFQFLLDLSLFCVINMSKLIRKYVLHQKVKQIHVKIEKKLVMISIPWEACWKVCFFQFSSEKKRNPWIFCKTLLQARSSALRQRWSITKRSSLSASRRRATHRSASLHSAHSLVAFGQVLRRTDTGTHYRKHTLY